MIEPLKPALTPEEWGDFPDFGRRLPDKIVEAPLYHFTKHGIAAANLHGQPFGFTREDLRDLTECWKITHQEGLKIRANDPNSLLGKHLYDVVQRMKSIAHRIEALLPPETP